MRLVVYPIIYRVFLHPRWLAGFLNHQQYCVQSTETSLTGTLCHFRFFNHQPSESWVEGVSNKNRPFGTPQSLARLVRFPMRPATCIQKTRCLGCVVFFPHPFWEEREVKTMQRCRASLGVTFFEPRTFFCLFLPKQHLKFMGKAGKHWGEDKVFFSLPKRRKHFPKTCWLFGIYLFLLSRFFLGWDLGYIYTLYIHIHTHIIYIYII